MPYVFPLALLYRADYIDEAWLFRRPNFQDLYPISEWIAATTRRSEHWRRKLYIQLLQEFNITAKLLQRANSDSPQSASDQRSWMVTVANKRCFLLEVADLAPRPLTRQPQHLTPHPLTRQPQHPAATVPPSADAPSADAEIFLTAPPSLLNRYPAACILWGRAVNQLLSLNTWRHFRVYLDNSRQAEAQALESLGFTFDGEFYVR